MESGTSGEFHSHKTTDFNWSPQCYTQEHSPGNKPFYFWYILGVKSAVIETWLKVVN